MTSLRKRLRLWALGWLVFVEQPTSAALQPLFTSLWQTVALLALGLTISNAAARRDGLIWLIWLHAILPGVISAWWLAGAPGLPRKAPPREALP